MNINSLTSSVVAASRRARAAAAASLAVLALGMTALLAPAASAATPVAGDFSPLINGNPSSGWLVDDCSGKIGFIYEPPPGWPHIGGVQVNCSSRHSFISATVALYYYNGSTWVQYGSSTYGVRYDSTGSGTAILKTPPTARAHGGAGGRSAPR